MSVQIPYQTTLTSSTTGSLKKRLVNTRFTSLLFFGSTHFGTHYVQERTFSNNQKLKGNKNMELIPIDNVEARSSTGRIAYGDVEA